MCVYAFPELFIDLGLKTYKAQKALRQCRFNRHYCQPIFDLFRLNRLPNSFWGSCNPPLLFFIFGSPWSDFACHSLVKHYVLVQNGAFTYVTTLLLPQKYHTFDEKCGHKGRNTWSAKVWVEMWILPTWMDVFKISYYAFLYLITPPETPSKAPHSRNDPGMWQEFSDSTRRAAHAHIRQTSQRVADFRALWSWKLWPKNDTFFG